jgi:hypothetical protein
MALKMIRQWISILGVLFAFLILLGACGSQDDSSVTPSEAAHDHDGEAPHESDGDHDGMDSSQGEHHHNSPNIMMAIPLDDADVIIEIEFRNGAVITSENRVSIRKGETVLFAVVSDVNEVIHIHGVDLTGEISSGDSKNYFGWTIKSSGIFEVEFENSGTYVTELLVS